MVNRTGYTGELGVELLVMADEADALWHGCSSAVRSRAGSARATPCGWRCATRCTDRTSARTPMPISAGLGWLCALDKDFTGAESLRKIKEEGPAERLAAFVMDDRAVPRAGMAIAEGGEVTSGTHSPMLDQGIGMGYVPSALASPGEKITIDVRGKDAACAHRPEAHLQARGALTWRQLRAIRKISATTLRTIGRGWRATRQPWASRGTRRTRSASSCTTSRPTSARTLAKDAVYGEVESVKAVSDLISPLSGEVVEVNQKAVDEPDPVNEDPYGEGWLVRIRLSDPAELDSLLDAGAYQQLLAES